MYFDLRLPIWPPTNDYRRPLRLFLCTLALQLCDNMPANSASSSWNGVARIGVPAIVAIGAVVASSLATLFLASASAKKRVRNGGVCCDDELRSSTTASIDKGGYESLIGNTPLLFLPHISSLFSNGVKIFVKMESLNPGGTGKDRAALNMILNAEQRGGLPPPIRRVPDENTRGDSNDAFAIEQSATLPNHLPPDKANNRPSASASLIQNNGSIPIDIHNAILTALHCTRTNGILIEGTSGSTGISLASLSCSRGHGVIVIMPDDQSSQKMEFLKRLGAGVVVVQNCSISNPGHYVNVARRVWEWLQKERRYDDYYWKNVACNTSRSFPVDNASQPPKLIQAAFMNQFENIANVQSHYMTTGPEIYSQLDGKVDAFVMSAGTGGTLVGVGGYLKEKWWQAFHHHTQSSPCNPNQKNPPKIVLIDPPGSSLFNKIKYGVAFAPQQAETRQRRHRYDTIAEGIGLDRITANFGLGCESIAWKNDDNRRSNNAYFGHRINMLMNPTLSHDRSFTTSNSQHTHKIIDDALSITDQQAVHMAHYLLRHEGLFVGSSTAMNLVGALVVASKMPANANIVTIVCDGGQRHTSRFWNKDFIVEQGLIWPGDCVMIEERNVDILGLLGINSSSGAGRQTHNMMQINI